MTYLINSDKPILIDEVEYFVTQDMVKDEFKLPKFLFTKNFRRLLLGSIGLSCLISSFIRFFVILGSFSASVVLLFMKYNKKFRDKVISIIIPKAMKGMDKQMKHIKENLLQDIKGDVLDFGSGGGGYLEYISKCKDAVGRITCLEPCKPMHDIIQKEATKFDLKIDIFGGFSHDLLKEKGEQQFDFIILGNVLCEVPDQDKVLKDIVKLLKPNGKIYFLEHVASKPKSEQRKFEDRYNFLWNIISGGCNWNRDTLKQIQKVPLDVYAWQLTDSKPFSNNHICGFMHKPAVVSSSSNL